MKDWKKLKLGDIAVISYGYTAKAFVANVGSKFLRITDIQNHSVNWSSVPYCQITEDDFEKYKLIDQDIVFARTGATTGKSYLVCDPPETVAASYLIRLRLKDANIDAKFISKYFQTKEYWDNISSGISGSAQGGFNASKLSELFIPIPPLPEQKRIVAILDEAFEGIDRAISNTEKNLSNARELFESYLNSIFSQKGEGWEEKKLREMGGKVFTGPFGSLLHKSDYVSNGIPIVNPANIEDDKIIPNFIKSISPDTVKRLQSYVLTTNDVVVARRGEIGRCAVVTEEQSGWLCGSGSFFIKPFEKVNSVFLAHLLRSAVYRSQLEKLSTGATMQNLSNQSLSDLVIAMPSLDEQNQITNRIDDLKSETQSLENIYRQKIAALKELKQSILQKAFTGELTVRLRSPTTADNGENEKEEIAA
ncbi:restriction endonuclease subunit S [Anabaena sp. CS-542/02]|uniref:restriction endonuclease subunit S n=1 Tax=Anabaena sp. CS-542/02 TaxID=3021719 RepID=UPI00232DF777|nr:restriction endonuclease subunit S [Anabaena sp. CS-542/02]MDB9445208.1 restriction endonuclease subunit S [Anabaena sp. CS-542/02]